MNLKGFSRLIFVLSTLVFSVSGCNSKSVQKANQLDIHPEVSIGEIQNALANGEYSIEDLTLFYLDRIEALDKNGPALNAVLTVNPDAIEIAKVLDKELNAGMTRGPLHGIPVLLKDNVDTKDKMPCTAGARAMKDSYPLSDSPLAAQLRAAGAVILGKTNLSEWANFHSSYSSSGWSGLGGQTKNPYKLSRNPCGSSAGSGVAVSSNLCVVAIGTETNGSIVCPSNNNGIVGVKPTVGLISRTGIIPISYNQDTGGPMARSVRDAAICLGTLTDVDSSDAKTLNPDRLAYKDYTQFLDEDGLQGKRIGYYKSPLGNDTIITAIMETAIEALKEKGAIIIDLDTLMDKAASDHSYQVLLYEFKDGLNAYFTQLGENAPVKNLNGLIEQTFSDSIEMQYFDHEILKEAQSKGDLTSKEYLEALKEMHRMSRDEGIDRVMNQYNLDAIVAPTGSPAWKTDLISGDKFGIFSSSPSAIAGYPIITVPMGNVEGLPLGLSFFGSAWSEGILIQIAYAYEQSTKHRLTPKFKK